MSRMHRPCLAAIGVWLVVLFPVAAAAPRLTAGFPALDAILRTPGVWDLEPAEFRQRVLPPEVELQQGTSDYPLLYAAQRSATWAGLPVWEQHAYETEYYCFDPARPMLKIHLGRPLIGDLHQARVESLAVAPRLRELFPALRADVPGVLSARIERLVEELKSSGARRLPFQHPKITRYLLPGGTLLTFSDFSGSQQGGVYVELTLEPAEPVRSKLNRRLPAFPGAEGFGALTPGGRGGNVYCITTLEDYLPVDRPGRPAGKLGQASIPPPGYDPKQWVPWIDPLGVRHEKEMQPLLPSIVPLPREPVIPGSLRAALEASGPRTIVFAVSGTIELKAPLEIRHPYVTLAGNTSPGAGIQLRNWGIRVVTHDVILRYLRVRVGDVKGPGPLRRVLGEQTHALDVTGLNVIVDHCEFAYANDQIVNFYGSRDGRFGASFQWNYVYGGLLRSTHEKGEHSMAMITDGWGFVSVHHNLLAHSRTRNPRAWGSYLDFRNNVLYDYRGSGYGNARDYLRLNYVGNTQRRGGWKWGFQADGPFGYFYSANNRMPEGAPPSALAVPAETLMSEPFRAPPVTTLAAAAAEEAILADGGASLPVRDSITEYVAETTRRNTGAIPNTTDDFPLGGFASYPASRPPVDSDGDGIPDEWELRHGLNPHDPADAAGISASGYTWLECYLHSIPPAR